MSSGNGEVEEWGLLQKNRYNSFDHRRIGPIPDPLPVMNPLPEAPILAEEAIEGTGLVEDGQILITIFGASGIGEAGISRG
jgi:hypothetical protein